ncbi:LacI family DNA-binding transcriptional regulator [Allopusillimonas soli]|uniref:Substrate-binding domain-containing protein n=1 Tax=Allopusillimonas soli TaxID=659016 RepID=A0A853FBS5_9BURK|nr:substrate-binding domain-containing protein [Allopusillimonas soli]NYT38225.1 substrate-binding domain-containing protein [Allopusillimonas soli]TEA72196.1 LacI family DNA-binding transcriptional regulator [Allopusillimonas soli]
MSKPASRRNTIADVARHAGVSKATVSRFLNHRDALLSPEIAARVEAAVAELGYVPSPMAQALKRGRSRLIGLVVADIANPYSVAVLRGAEQACRKAGYLVMLFNLGNERERESAGLKALASYKVEGYILNTMGHDTGSLLETATQGKPVVLVDRLHPGLDVDFVSLDNRQAIGDSASHLLARGYRELLFVTEPRGAVSSRIERSRAFEDFLVQHAMPGQAVSGQSLDSAVDDQETLVQALQALRRRAAGASPAVISGNAVVTLQVVAAVARLGWRLGRDIGLIGIDDTPWAPFVGPGISAMAQPTDRIGQLAAQCLLQRVGGLDTPARRMLLPGLLAARGSTRRQ